jgi:hypothetical protein
MIYSVYDHESRHWDYYEGSGGVPTTAFFRDSGVGAHPDRLAAVLPPDAVHVGAGELPRGVVAARRAHQGLSGFGQVDPASGTLSWIGLAFVVGGVFWLGRKSVGAKGRVASKVRKALL